MPALILRPEIQDRMVRGLHLKGGSPAPHLHDKVMPVVLVDDFTVFGQVEKLAGGGVFVFTPTVGQFGSVCLFNAPGTGVSLLLDTLFVSGPIAWTERFSPTALTTLVAAATGYKDTLAQPGFGAVTIGRIFTDTTVGPIAAGDPVGGGQGTTLRVGTYQAPIAVLAPGTAYIVASNVVTTGITAVFSWRERPIVVK